jgi:hypothetical protein
MTRTEERLRDALQASATRVQDDRLRRLPSLEPQAERMARRRQAWRAWLIPAAAAASVALVVSLAVALTGGPQPAPSGRGPTGAGLNDRGPSGAGPTGTASPQPPGYFADFSGRELGQPIGVAVYARSDGKFVGRALQPEAPGWTLEPDAVAAAPDDRTFYVEYDADRPGRSSVVAQVWVYSFGVTSAGRVTPMTRIKGGVMSGQAGLGTGGPMAVSPDGTKLALTADTTVDLNYNTQGYSDKIVIIDLRTGRQSVWQGGMYRTGKVFSIPSLSWTADGQSLVYLALWCNFPGATNPCTGTSGPDGYRYTQVRSIRVASGGGTLSSGLLLLSQSSRYPVIVAAVAGPDGSDLSVLVLSGRVNASGEWSRVTVEHAAIGNGPVLGVDYGAATRGVGGKPDWTWLSADPSGRYLLFSYQATGGLVTGWIGQGRVHLLPVKQPYLGYLITAW